MPQGTSHVRPRRITLEAQGHGRECPHPRGHPSRAASPAGAACASLTAGLQDTSPAPSRVPHFAAFLDLPSPVSPLSGPQGLANKPDRRPGYGRARFPPSLPRSCCASAQGGSEASSNPRPSTPRGARHLSQRAQPRGGFCVRRQRLLPWLGYNLSCWTGLLGATVCSDSPTTWCSSRPRVHWFSLSPALRSR